MANSSSTSSSEKTEPSPRVPIAFIGALVILLGIEVLARQQLPKLSLPYNMGDAQYRVLHDHLLLHGPSEIAIVGSSRIRDAIVSPIVTEKLHAAGITMSFANFATGAGTAEDGSAALR